MLIIGRLSTLFNRIDDENFVTIYIMNVYRNVLKSFNVSVKIKPPKKFKVTKV